MEVTSLLLTFLIVYLAYRNGLIARQKGKKPVGWVVLTIVSYLFFYMIGIGVVEAILIHNSQININAESLQTKDQILALSYKMNQLIYDNPLHVITMDVFGLGGYLLIRYVLESMPIKNMPKDREGVV